MNWSKFVPHTQIKWNKTPDRYLVHTEVLGASRVEYSRTLQKDEHNLYDIKYIEIYF